MYLRPSIHSHYPRIGDQEGQNRLRVALRTYEKDDNRGRLQEMWCDYATEVIQEQQQAGNPRDQREQDDQHGHLAQDVVRAREGPGQV